MACVPWAHEHPHRPHPAPHPHHRRRFWRAGSGQGAGRAGGGCDAGGQDQPPPVPAPALPGGHGGFVGPGHRSTDPQHSAQAGQPHHAAGGRHPHRHKPAPGAAARRLHAGLRPPDRCRRCHPQLLRPRRLGTARAGPENTGRRVRDPPPRAAGLRVGRERK